MTHNLTHDYGPVDVLAALREWAHKGLDRHVLTGSEREAATMFVELDDALSTGAAVPPDWRKEKQVNEPEQRREDQRRDLAAAIAAQATAIAEGRVVGPQWAAVQRLRSNVDTLTAWTEDDRT